eukprot:3262429-Heterocapsa_arctica.AAC.1
MKSYQFMIGLIADDIAGTPGYDKGARLDVDALQKSDLFRNIVAGRLMQFFGSLAPSASDMYTCRGRMSTE